MPIFQCIYDVTVMNASAVCVVLVVSNRLKQYGLLHGAVLLFTLVV